MTNLAFPRGAFALSAALLALAACSADVEQVSEVEPHVVHELGPADGLDLVGAEPDRIALGDMAPEFFLESYRGDTLGVTDYRGKSEVILVFYRGSW